VEVGLVVGVGVGESWLGLVAGVGVGESWLGLEEGSGAGVAADGWESSGLGVDAGSWGVFVESGPFLISSWGVDEG
jgi:hypothetical protein